MGFSFIWGPWAIASIASSIEPNLRRMYGRILARGEEPTIGSVYLDQIHGSWNLPPQGWHKINLYEV